VASSVVLTASLIAGPQGASDCGFPAGVTSLNFGLTPPQKPAPALIDGARNINSPGSYVTLDGLGPTSTVTQANFVYLRTQSPFKVRITQADPAGGPDIVSVVNLQGVMLLEFPTTGYAKLVEVQGVGTVEYLLSGNL
jgi:hypothetical protein